MRRRFLSLILSALCTAAVAVSPARAEVTVETATGKAVVADVPQKVAVFDIAVADTLQALGVEMAGMPSNLYVSYLKTLAGKGTPVGTIFEPDYEALAVLGPDLVIVGPRTSDKVEMLSQIAPVINMSIMGGDVEAALRSRIAAYGKIFGIEAKADALLARLDVKIAAARAAVKGKGRGLIILANGNKISAFGPGSRFGWIHTVVGLPLATESLEVSVHGHAISFEFIAEVDPDWLLVIDRGAAIGQDGAAQATLDNAIIARTKAAKAGRIVYLDPAPIYVAGGGATSMMTTLDELIAAFGKSGG